ncbi:Ycf49-like protein [Citrus sinensis]|uniref:Ycf49-like protein n=2 Tax=Citrus TaxID=2706 RepID=A0A067F8S2_CITSI|nr:uncharacterized protein LOC18046656 isoform X1 [Citrus x clementina]XP_006477318.2 uncharacterized protein LOC102616293 isoform X1 [Citrus sinensis]ESR53687.1 hypothetical protein CICLE_v10024430mg [Citrus x clementina]KAH9721550.1 Ycf49-like protein [Citrus sinensis]KDO63713.1 hypothetical protein CISIN_1g030334mg [Citrus sinensis]KDO63714.1 hypothetical protein CISIN_1g030334mg [Citrus sinensis]
MAITTTLLLHPPNPISTHNHKRTLLLSNSTRTRKPIKSALINGRGKAIGGLIGAGLALTLLEPVSAAELPLQLSEPANALSLPTWAIHVSSVAEWITAMALVWQYGEKSGFESWKGLSWGMVPLLGGAFCACTWHFFYNSESLEVLVALQGALTVIGNATMCYAAYRIYKSSEERSQNL